MWLNRRRLLKWINLGIWGPKTERLVSRNLRRSSGSWIINRPINHFYHFEISSVARDILSSRKCQFALENWRRHANVLSPLYLRRAQQTSSFWGKCKLRSENPRQIPINCHIWSRSLSTCREGREGKSTKSKDDTDFSRVGVLIG